MEISFYDTRVIDSHITLVKERTVECLINRVSKPLYAVELINSTASLNELGEEHCYMVALDQKEMPLGIFLITKGTVCQCMVGMREVYMRALLVGAVQIFFFHNHPTGDTAPSRLDMELTDRLKKAGELMGIPLIDHIIIGGDGYFSFKEHGML